MKRLCILFVLTVLGVHLFAQSSPVARKIIDFTLFPEPAIEAATLLDFQALFGDVNTPVLHPSQLDRVHTSLAINSWEVEFPASSRRSDTLRRSDVRSIAVPSGANAGQTVLGARIYFPTENYNSWALIRPPFDIPVSDVYIESGVDGIEGTLDDVVRRFYFEDEGQEPNDGLPPAQILRSDPANYYGLGVIKNVAEIKSVSAEIYGLNYPHTVGIVLADRFGQEIEYPLGTLQYEGWRRLTWENPNYISDISIREYPEITPRYPNPVPLVRFVGIRVYRDAAIEGGYFVTYVRDVELTYDLASLPDDQLVFNADFQDEEWKVIFEQEQARRQRDFRAIGVERLLRSYEEALAVETREQAAGQQ